MKILYCDPDQNFQAKFKTYLEAYGFEVQCLTDSSQVLKRLSETAFDMLICDLWVEPLPCRELCEGLRASEQSTAREIPVLLVAPEVLEAGEFLWARKLNLDFLVKYKSPEDWYQKISTLIGKERVRL